MFALGIPVPDCEASASACKGHGLTCDGPLSKLGVVFDLKCPESVLCRSERVFHRSEWPSLGVLRRHERIIFRPKIRQSERALW